MPTYVVVIKRADRNEHDPVHIRADTRDEAVNFVKKMYDSNFICVVRATRYRRLKQEERACPAIAR